MTQKIQILIDKSKLISNSYVKYIVLNPEDLAYLREEMNISIEDDLEVYKNIKLFVHPNVKLSVINELKTGRLILFDGKRIRNISREGEICDEQFIQDVKV